MLTEDVRASLPISQGCLSQVIRTGGRKSTVGRAGDAEPLASEPERAKLAARPQVCKMPFRFGGGICCAPTFSIPFFQATGAGFGTTGRYPTAEQGPVRKRTASPGHPSELMGNTRWCTGSL